MTDKKPKEMLVTLKFQVPMEYWDDDVDWSNPEKVVREQMEIAGWEDVIDNMSARFVKLEVII